jgi:hypothetical protein
MHPTHKKRLAAVGSVQLNVSHGDLQALAAAPSHQETPDLRRKRYHMLEVQPGRSWHRP